MDTYDYDRFQELLSVLNEEELIRVAYRLHKMGHELTACHLEDALNETRATNDERNIMNPEEEHQCSICGGKYTGFGNNAWPINDGRCCNACNELVIVRRLRCYTEWKEAKKPKLT